MSKIKVGKLTRRLFTLTGLLACLTLVTPSNTSTTIAAAPAQSSGYQLSGNVYHGGQGGPLVVYPSVDIYKWNGSSWVWQELVEPHPCDGYTYDTGGPGLFKAVVDGDYRVISNWSCSPRFTTYEGYMFGSETAELTSASPTATLNVYTYPIY